MASSSNESEYIRKTQDQLGAIIKKPPLTEKLLSKPPFRFLHDVIMAVIKQTGFMDGLYDGDEMDAQKVNNDKDAKMTFLQKAIDIVQMANGESLASVKPAKIVAGQEANRTNEFLQSLAKATKKASANNADLVKRVLRGDKFDGAAAAAAAGASATGDSGGSAGSNKENRDRSASKKKDEKDAGKSTKEAKKESSSKERSSSKDRTVKEKPKDGSSSAASSKEKSKEKEDGKTRSDSKEKVASSSKDKEKEKTRSSSKTRGEGEEKKKKNADGSSQRRSSISKSATPAKPEAGDDRKRRSSKSAKSTDEKKADAKSEEKPSSKRRQSSAAAKLEGGQDAMNGEKESKKRSSSSSRHKDKEKPAEEGAGGGGLRIDLGTSAQRQYNGDEPEDESMNHGTHEEERPRFASQSAKENGSRMENDDQEATSSLKISGTIIRSGAARPSSAAGVRPGTAAGARPGTAARPAPPRMKRQELGPAAVGAGGDTQNGPVVNEQQNGLPTAPAVQPAPILIQHESSTKNAGGRGKDDDDDDDFIVESRDAGGIDALILNGDDEAGDGDTGADLDGETGEHGQLVRKILETKKELESQLKSTTVDKPLIVFDAQEREKTKKETGKLQELVQQLTRTSHPLAKIVDFLQEDVDSMLKELQQWRQEAKKDSDLLRQETGVRTTGGVGGSVDIETLKNKLSELDQQIVEQSESITAIRGVILVNEQRIEKMMMAVAKK